LREKPYQSVWRVGGVAVVSPDKRVLVRRVGGEMLPCDRCIPDHSKPYVRQRDGTLRPRYVKIENYPLEKKKEGEG